MLDKIPSRDELVTTPDFNARVGVAPPLAEVGQGMEARPPVGQRGLPELTTMAFDC